MRSDPILVFADNPGPMTGRGNNTWLIDGVEPTLVDAGVGRPTHVAAVARRLGHRALVRVLATHGHSDHAGGLPVLSERWPSIEACKFTLHGETGWRALVDGTTVRAGDGVLSVIHTPGHAADHVCFWDGDRRYLYAGDMLLADTTVVIPAGRGGHLGQYLRSLERLAALEPLRIYPGHGVVIDRPLEAIAAYIEHRLMREQQVVDALRDGVVGIEAIVNRLYPRLSDALRPAARLTVEAHMEKLREEGRLG